MDFFLASLASIFMATASAQPANLNPDGNFMGRTVAQAPKTDDVPVGGCMPIGLTANGVFVFPMTCQEVLGRVSAPSSAPSSVVESDRPAAQSGGVRSGQSVPQGVVVTPPSAPDPLSTGTILKRSDGVRLRDSSASPDERRLKRKRGGAAVGAQKSKTDLDNTPNRN